MKKNVLILIVLALVYFPVLGQKENPDNGLKDNLTSLEQTGKYKTFGHVLQHISEFHGKDQIVFTTDRSNINFSINSLIFYSDFDDGTLQGWGTISNSGITTERSYSGSYSIKVNDTSYNLAECYRIFSPTSKGSVEFWVYIPSGNDYGITMKLADKSTYMSLPGGRFQININPPGDIKYYRGTTFYDFPTPASISLNKWEKLKFQWDCVANEFELFINNVSYGKGLNRETGGDIRQIIFQSGSSADTSEFGYFDNIRVEQITAIQPTITVTSPNGGESWEVGTYHKITWTSSGTVGNVRIEYSSDNGSSWKKIISSTPNDGSYTWTVPNTPSSNCKVRVKEAADGSPSDTSNSTFPIVSSGPPNPIDPRGLWTVKFYDPYDQSYWSEQQIELTGGLTSGTVTWINETNCSPTENWNLDYPRIYIFKNCPSNPDGGYLIDAGFTNNDYAEGSAWVGSDEAAHVKISRQGSTPNPTIIVTYPNGGETWFLGTKEEIRWTSSNISGNVTIDLYKNGSKVSKLGVANSLTGKFIWDISTNLDPNAYYQVRIYQGKIEDFTDGNFLLKEPEIPNEPPKVLFDDFKYSQTDLLYGDIWTAYKNNKNKITLEGSAVCFNLPKNYVGIGPAAAPKHDTVPHIWTEKKYNEGVYVARIFFDGQRIDPVVHAFWLQCEWEPLYDQDNYAEVDFEYLPFSFWTKDDFSQAMWVSTWEKAVPEKNDSHDFRISLDGKWAICQMKVYPENRVEFYLYDDYGNLYVDKNGKKTSWINEKGKEYAPESITKMSIDFSMWVQKDFITQTNYKMKVDWVIHIPFKSNSNSDISKTYGNYGISEIMDLINTYRDNNINVRDTTTSESGISEIALNRTQLNFGVITSESISKSQSLIINNTGDGALNWSISKNQAWISCSPTSGAASGTVIVSVNPMGLSPGSYNATITVTDPNATNSPQTVNVTLTVYANGQTSPPFGTFETPKEGSAVSSSIPVTGWVLDDIEVSSVNIYNGKTYVGDALFVEGARPDVEAAYPGYPMNYQAGWGYMLLTNFLPNGGNGQYTLIAKARDIEGHEVTLGSKTITVDNANAVKPFGAIDTPAQGGTASGSDFVNWGWVLTPMPNSIPTDGSTINVWVDGVDLGHPNYNHYRSDIANKFPGYANSDGAIGYFYLDTTAYDNGVHTIQWTATDTGGNTDGIGSRYFTIQNTGADAGASVAMDHGQLAIGELSRIEFNTTQPFLIQKGFKGDNFEKPVSANDDGEFRIKIRELEPISIKMAGNVSIVACYQLVGNQIRKMPVGMILKDNTLYWMPGVAYLGNYRFVIVERDENGELSKRFLGVTIEPKFLKVK